MAELESPLLQQPVGQVDSRKGSFMSSVFTLANAAVGCGVLSFPYAFAQAGWLLGSLLCVVYAVILGRSMIVLAQATEDYERKSTTLGTTSFQDLCLALLGPWGKATVELSMLVFLFGSCCAYLIVVGDMVQPAVNGMDLGFNITRGTAIACAGTVTMLPLSMLPTMAALQYSSAVAVLSIGYMVALLMVRGIKNWDENIGSLVAFNTNWNLIESANGATRALLAVPIICFALQCHVQTPSVYSELRGATVSRMKRIATCTMTICICLYLPAGTFGVLACGQRTKDFGDIMKCFKDDSDVATQIARFCIATAAICAYPLNAFPARSALLSLGGFIRQQVQGSSDMSFVSVATDDEFNNNALENEQGLTYTSLADSEADASRASDRGNGAEVSVAATGYRLQTLIWYLASLGVALSVNSLSAVLALLGSTVAVVVMFLVPSAILYTRLGRRLTPMMVLLVCFGVFAMVIGIVTTLDGIAKG